MRPLKKLSSISFVEKRLIINAYLLNHSSITLVISIC